MTNQGSFMESLGAAERVALLRNPFSSRRNNCDVALALRRLRIVSINEQKHHFIPSFGECAIESEVVQRLIYLDLATAVSRRWTLVYHSSTDATLFHP